MQLDRLWITDFRNYDQAYLEPAAAGLTVVVGGNGVGKTNLIEAIGYLATLQSFRGAPSEALVRRGHELAVVRAEGRRRDRNLLIEAELRPTGRDRVQVNRQPLRRTSDLADALQVTVFAPDDLALVKGSPQARREYLDGALSVLHPRNRGLRSDLDRILRQRNSLLKQAGGGSRPDSALLLTLDVWDSQLAITGTALADARDALVHSLAPIVQQAYGAVLGDTNTASANTAVDPASAYKGSAGVRGGGFVSIDYERSWDGDLGSAIALARTDDLRRGVTTVGPQRDELALKLDGMPARTHSSQGEQRCIALALRLATHTIAANASGSTPILLLDDVFSELDEARSEALLSALPPGQALLTTAGALPPGADPALTVRIEGGKILQ